MTDDEFENFNDGDAEWLSELELRTAELETELFDLREAHARELAETSYGLDGAPRRNGEGRPGMLRAQPRQAQARQAQARQAQARQAQARPAQRRPAPPQPARPLDDEMADTGRHFVDGDGP